MKREIIEQQINEVVKMVVEEVDLLSAEEEDVIKSIKLGKIVKDYILATNDDMEELKQMILDLGLQISKINRQEKA